MFKYLQKYIGAVRVFHHPAESRYTHYKLTFHQLLTFNVHFQTYPV